MWKRLPGMGGNRGARDYTRRCPMPEAPHNEGQRILAEAARQIRSGADAEAAPLEQPAKVSSPGHSAAVPTAGGWQGIWLPPLLLGSVALGVVLLLKRPDGLWSYVVGGMVALTLGWIVVSSLWPGKPDRTCPECGSEGLQRLDEQSHRGLRCRDCGYQDETASSFMIAEEEGTLEETVLRERGRKRIARGESL